jgi:hypothetical protein
MIQPLAPAALAAAMSSECPSVVSMMLGKAAFFGFFPYRLDHFDPVHARHVDVGYDEREAFRLRDLGDPVGSVDGLDHLESCVSASDTCCLTGAESSTTRIFLPIESSKSLTTCEDVVALLLTSLL